MKLTAPQLDRVVGAVVGSAAGDALGAPYEFGPTHPDDFEPRFGRGAGGEAPAQWTDDTAMAVALLDALAAGLDLDSDAGMAAVIDGWYRWRAEDGRGIGIQTAQIMSAARDRTEASLRAASKAAHARTGKTAGNGSLMRVGPLALGYLGEGREVAMLAAAERVTLVTHEDEDNVAAVAIWSAMIRRAILDGVVDPDGALSILADRPELAARWATIIADARAASHPREFADGNGWVVRAFQAALVAVEGARDYRDAMYRAVQGGRDTDTVAAIAGALAGARWGATQIPLGWQRRIHGWPGYRANDLARQAILAARGGQPDSQGWPTGASVLNLGFLHTAPVQHPLDPGVWLGSQSALRDLPPTVSAVVSLGRVGTAEIPDGIESVRVWLIDTDGLNLNLDTTLVEAADVIAELRAEGKEVFVHCAEARSRTSSVAALYAVRHRGATLDAAWSALDGRRGSGVLPYFEPAAFLRAAVARIAAG